VPSSHVNDSKHWRDRADEMRSLSLLMHHFDIASIVLAVAEDYDRLADHASGNAPVMRTIAHCREG
jgi:hypothetical protein